MHDKPQTFLTVVDKTSVHRQVLHGVAIRVRSFEFTTGEYGKVHVCQGSLLQVKVTVDNVKGWGCWAMGILA